MISKERFDLRGVARISPNPFLGNRKKYLILPALLLLVGYFSFLNIKQQSVNQLFCEDCNVILVSLDTLGAKHLGVYGSTRPTSPFLDQLAKEKGLVFTNAIAQAPWTLPSHASILTSRYPYEYKIWTLQDALPLSAKTIAQVMKDRGYRTKAFSNGPFVQPEWGFDRGFESFSGSIKPSEWEDSPKIFENALSWTKENSHKPFFLFVRSFMVHLPYRPSPESLRWVGGGDPYSVELKDVSSANSRLGGSSKEEDRRFEAAYDAEIRDLDQGLKVFFDGLAKQGLLKKTIVILVSDHGEAFGEHGVSGDHLTLHDEVIRVPLIIFLPNANPRSIPGVVEVRSIPPSIIQMTKLPKEPEFSERTLFDALSDTEGGFVALSSSSIKTEEALKVVDDSYDKVISLFGTVILPKAREEEWVTPYGISARSKSFHLIKNIDGTIELYDLRKDPLETKNIYADWSSLSGDDRRDALPVLRSLGTGVPFNCGLYCADSNFNRL